MSVAEGGARQEGGLDRQRRRRSARCFDNSLWRMTAQGRGRLGMAPRRTRAVLGGQRSALGAEERDERQSRVGWKLGGYRGTRGKRGLGMAATRDKGTTCTWRPQLHGLRVERRCRAVDSADVRWQVVTEPPHCRRVRVSSHWPDTQPWAVVGRWQAGPVVFLNFSRFSNTHTLIFELVTFLISKFLQILQVDCLIYKEQLLLLDQL
jgi:hypothetical protein